MTIKRISFVQELLKFAGLGGRLRLEWISSAEATKFTNVVTDFTETIRSLGRSPLYAGNTGTAKPVNGTKPVKDIIPAVNATMQEAG